MGSFQIVDPDIAAVQQMPADFPPAALLRLLPSSPHRKTIRAQYQYYFKTSNAMALGEETGKLLPVLSSGLFSGYGQRRLG